jgi:toxin secretion/phage lysis holin
LKKQRLLKRIMNKQIQPFRFGYFYAFGQEGVGDMNIKMLLSGALTAIVGSNEKVAGYSGVASIASVFVSSYLGGWDIGMKVLIFFMIFDYVTGVLGAIKQRNLNSEIMFWGGIKKSVIIIVLAMSVLLDELVGNDAPIFRTMVIYFYVSKEGLSVVENLGILGVPMPDFLSKVLTQLEDRSKGGGKQ